MLEHPVNDVKEFVHNGADDNDLWLALGFQSLGKCFADRVEAHCGHGGKEQVFSQLAIARFAHGCASFAAGT